MWHLINRGIFILFRFFYALFNTRQRAWNHGSTLCMNPRALILALSLVLLEWLDFSLYLYLAKSVFAREFFAANSQSLMLSFAVFAAAYLARPLGGWLFGRKADKSGRRTPMVYSAALMGLSTLGMCLLPGYAILGPWAVWGLLLFRIGQGLALGGEMKTSAMFFVEHHSQRRLFAGSLIAISAALGMFVGGALAATIQYLEWNGLWRLVFAGLGMISLWICSLRQQLQESPEFLKSLTIKAAPWQTYWPAMLNIAALGIFISVSVYLCNVFWASFASDQGLMSGLACTWTAAFAQLLAAIFALFIAMHCQDHQVYHLMKSSMLLMALVAPVLFYSTVKGFLPLALLSVAAYSVANGLFSSSLYYFLYLQLPVKIRCTAISIIWGLAASVGAISLPVAQKAAQMGQVWVVAAMVFMAAVLAHVVLRFNEGYQLARNETALKAKSL